MILPDWIPYKYYSDKSAEIIHLQEQAKRDFLFFLEIYDALLEKRDLISFELHPTGVLPLLSGRQKVTDVNVIKTKNGYQQKINQNIIDEILYFPNRIQLNIWWPIAERWSFNEVEYKQLELYKQIINFSNRLYDFRRNGFQEDCDSEPYILHIHNDEMLIKYYQEMFSDIYINKNDVYAEVNANAYEKIPIILEKIAKDVLIYFKTIGLIPYIEA